MNHWGHLSAAAKVEKPVQFYPPPLPPLLFFISLALPLSPLLPLWFLSLLCWMTLGDQWLALPGVGWKQNQGQSLLGCLVCSLSPTTPNVALHPRRERTHCSKPRLFSFLNHKACVQTSVKIAHMSKWLICNYWLGTYCFLFCTSRSFTLLALPMPVCLPVCEWFNKVSA